MAEVIHMRTHKYLMISVGLWRFDKYDTFWLRVYKIYAYSILIYNFGMLQMMLASIVLQWKCQDIAMELVGCYVQYTNTFIMLFISKYSNIEKVIDHMLDFEKKMMKKGTKHQDIYLKYAEVNNKATFFVIAISYAATVYWYISCVWYTVNAPESEDCPLVKAVVYQLKYPFDDKKYQWFVILNDTVFLISTVSLTIYREVMVLSTIIFMVGQIKMLQQRIKDLAQDSEEIQRLKNVTYERAMNMALNECVKDHQNTIKLMEMMRKSTSAFLLISYFTNSLEMAAYSVRMISHASIANVTKAFVVFLMMISELYVFFKYANEIVIESTAISDIIYNDIDWQNFSQSVKKKLIMLMSRSQQQLSFKALIIGDMSLETYTRLLKLCYTIVTVFRVVYKI